MKHIFYILCIILPFYHTVSCVSDRGDRFYPKENPSEIRIRILNIAHREGSIMLAVHCSETNYAKSGEPVIAAMKKVTGSTMNFAFHGNFAPGTYGVVVYHDEDGNGELKMNKYGIPLEGFGFSRNPVLSGGKPDWIDISFSVKEGVHEETIRMMYATTGVK